MEPKDFCYWLQGFSELTPEPPSQAQWDSIREHLATVFKKVTPPVLAKPKVPYRSNFDIPPSERIC